MAEKNVLIETKTPTLLEGDSAGQTFGGKLAESVAPGASSSSSRAVNLNKDDDKKQQMLIAPVHQNEDRLGLASMDDDEEDDVYPPRDKKNDMNMSKEVPCLLSTNEGPDGPDSQSNQETLIAPFAGLYAPAAYADAAGHVAFGGAVSASDNMLSFYPGMDPPRHLMITDGSQNSRAT
ncbi:unnamed protein product, partial [Amoebophrya sp. A25]|eukprot:GSA25T00006070001.1